MPGEVYGIKSNDLSNFWKCREGGPTYKKAEGARGGPPEPPTCHPSRVRRVRACADDQAHVGAAANAV